MTSQYKIKSSPICFTNVPEWYFSLYGQPFSSMGKFRGKWTVCSPNDIEHLKVKGTLYLFYQCSDSHIVVRFGSTTKCFLVMGQFETRAPNNLKMALDAIS